MTNLDTVSGTNELRGAKLAVQHLASLGHQRIVHIDGAANASAPERRSGYRSGMRAAGLERLVDVRTGGDSETDALNIVDSLMAEPEPPTAIFAFNDLVAMGALDRLYNAGVSVPGDISLVGFDNRLMATLRYISLTTVSPPALAMGSLAVDTLLERVGGGSGEPIRRTLQPELVVRSTTAPPASGPWRRSRRAEC